MKELIAPLAVAAALALSGCGGADAPTTKTVESVTEDAPRVPDVVGSWKQSNPNSEENCQQATVTADTITIEWVADGGKTTSIYWVGTFEAPTEESTSFESVWDEEATDPALLASTEDSKEFMVEGETISYKVSALGFVKLACATEEQPSPRTLGRTSSALVVLVDDVDGHYGRSKAAGARIVRPLEDKPWGLRQYTVEDVEGHRWEFSQQTRRVPPHEWGARLAT